MDTYLSARTAVLSFHRGTLVMSGLRRRDVSVLFERELWVWDTRIFSWRCEAIHYEKVRRVMLQHLGNRFQDKVPQPQRVSWKGTALPELRKDQQEALAAWRSAGGPAV